MNEILRLLARFATVLTMLFRKPRVERWYDTKAAAELLGKPAYTIREYCRQGRIRAEKRPSGRRATMEWAISHDELMRIKAEGLLPDPMKRRHPRR